MVESIQYGGAYHQQGGRYLVQMCHAISMEECIISTVEGMQYRPVISSVQRRLRSTWLPKLPKGSWWLCLFGKIIFYRQYNPDFIPL